MPRMLARLETSLSDQVAYRIDSHQGLLGARYESRSSRPASANSVVDTVPLAPGVAFPGFTVSSSLPLTSEVVRNKLLSAWTTGASYAIIAGKDTKLNCPATAPAPRRLAPMAMA
jgi:hypothetical protein